VNGTLRLATGGTIVALWLGAALLTATTVAPVAFAVLPTRTLAGEMVGRVLPVVFISGMLVGLAYVWLAIHASIPRALLAGAMVIACGVAQVVVAPRIARLRAEIGSAVDALAIGDSRRVLFGRMHALSVGSLGVAMVCAAAVLLLTLLALRGRSS
jgi:hypothetical protein